MGTTTAATEARRAATEEMLQRLTLVLRQMRREHAAVTVAAVARRAAVSRTFLYQNARARTLIASAAGEQTGSAGERGNDQDVGGGDLAGAGT